MIYEVALLASSDFENLLLASAYPLHTTEILPLIVVSINWYFSISEISFKLTLAKLSMALQIQPVVHK